MDKIKWIIFTVVVVGILGGIIWFNKSSEVTFTGDAGKVISEGPIVDQATGSKDQKVVLIEYGDYQCPGCGSVAAPVNELVETYKSKLTFVFRNLPLTNIHPNALAASTAAEAAGLQGKFWQMHDLLYANQTSWASVDATQRSSVFESYANQIGLNLDKYRQDLNSKDIIAKINRDRSTAKTFKADSTPTFVLNGQKFDPNKSTDIGALTQAVEDALKAAYPDFKPAKKAE